MKRLLGCIAAAFLLVTSACYDDPARPDAAAETSVAADGHVPSGYTLTILHNNDGESDLLPDDEVGGIARFATVVNRIRGGIRIDGTRGVILVSSGDNFLAGPQFNASLEKGPPFFDAIALDAIGYNAFAIGNHEFDFGPDVLADFIGSFRSDRCPGPPPAAGAGNPRPRCAAPFLSSNLDVSGEPRLAALAARDRIAASTIVRLPGGPVGVIGATTPNLPFISSPRNVVVDADVAGAINAEIASLSARGVNRIVLISHLQSVAEDLALIPMLSGVDVVVAGGGDELLANSSDPLIPGDVPFGPYPLVAVNADGADVPVVTTSGQYRYVGRLDVVFDRLGNVIHVGSESGPDRVVGTSFTDGVSPDPFIQAAVEDPVEASVAALASNIIGASDVDLDGRRSQVRTRETNQGDLIADALFWQASQLASSFGAPAPNVALQNGGGIRNDEIVPAGPISELKTFEMLPFSNFVTIVPNIPRSQFKEILENAVSRVAFVDGRFAQISGFSFTYDPTGTAQVLDGAGNVVTPGTRIVDVTLNGGTAIVTGGVVQSGPALNIATIDFLARGGDQYPYRGAPFTSIGVTYQQALENYIAVGLGGVVSGVDYPLGGSGRITP